MTARSRVPAACESKRDAETYKPSTPSRQRNVTTQLVLDRQHTKGYRHTTCARLSVLSTTHTPWLRTFMYSLTKNIRMQAVLHANAAE